MNKIYFLYLAFSITVLTDFATCDYYTSVVGLDILLTAEHVLVDYFEHYLTQTEVARSSVETVFEEIEQNFLEIYENFESGLKYYENPLNAFKIIRRIVTDWPNLSDGTHGINFQEELHKYVADLESQYVKPTYDDLMGAAKGLLRLQKTYALETEDVAEGILNAEKVSSELLASDCFEIGRVLSDAKEYGLSAEWLMQAQMRWANEKSAADNGTYWTGNTTEVKILEHLAPIMSLLGHHKLASKLNNEILALDSNNKYAVENEPIYRANLVSERRKPNLEDETNISEAEKAPLSKIEAYEKTCRGELRRSPKEEGKLRCRFAHNNVPFCFIAPFQMEEISFDPFVAVYYNAIYDNEIDKIITIGNDTVERSKVGTVTTSQYSDIRTSKNTWLWFHENAFMKNIAQRLTDITGLSLDSAEALQVANYGIGGHYGPHYDFTEMDTAANFGDRGNRILTALFYINDVQMGGGTAFPYLKILVPPIKRSLLVWHNMHESLELDYRTLHAGCPVLKGSKWICNEWFHVIGQEFRRPCSIQQLGNRSIEFKDKYI